MSLAGLRGGTSLLLSIISARGGSMSATGTQSTATKEGASLVVGFLGCPLPSQRRSISFYTEQLGFKLDQENLPAFGQVSFGNLKLILSGPKALGRYPPLVLTATPPAAPRSCPLAAC